MLPKKRIWLLIERLGNKPRGTLRNWGKGPVFKVHECHTRWVWWKFYRSDA